MNRSIRLKPWIVWALSCLLSSVSFAAPAPGQTATARAAYDEVTLTGFTRACAHLPLVAEASGRILEVHADLGERIEAQGLFAQIDPTFIRLDLENNAVQRRQLQSRIGYDSREAERYRTLTEKGSASRSRLDELEQTLRDNRHRLQVLEVEAQILDERLARTRVPAPAGWRVTRRLVEPGQRVNDGDVLGEVADFSTLLVPIALSPRQYAALRTAQDTLSLTLPDSGRQVAARVYRVNPGFDAATRKISLDLALSEPLEQQRGGLRVSLALRLPAPSGAVLLPAAAVQESYEEYWVTRDNGERVQVVRLGTLGASGGERVKVASPRIKAGDRFRLGGTGD